MNNSVAFVACWRSRHVYLQSLCLNATQFSSPKNAIQVDFVSLLATLARDISQCTRCWNDPCVFRDHSAAAKILLQVAINGALSDPLSKQSSCTFGDGCKILQVVVGRKAILLLHHSFQAPRFGSPITHTPRIGRCSSKPIPWRMLTMRGRG